MMLRKILMLAIMVAFAASLSACGRKNQPVAPDTVEETYPRQYPAETPVPPLSK